MQKAITTTDHIKNLIHTQPTTIHKRIGSIVYEVEIRFNPNATETFNDKQLRLIRRDMEASP